MFKSILAIILFLGVAFLLSNNKKNIKVKPLIGAIGLEIAILVFMLKIPLGQKLFGVFNKIIVKLLSFVDGGVKFVFGDYLTAKFCFLFNALMPIIFFSALMAVLYHLGIMQKVVGLIAKVITRITGTSGAETTNIVANMFVGMTESPQTIKPYLKSLTQSELFTIILGGMASIPCFVIASYAGVSHAEIGHIVTACALAPTTTLLIAKLMYPETDKPLTQGNVKIKTEKEATNVLEALSNGTLTGVNVVLAIGGMLISFLAMVAFLNYVLGMVGGLVGMNYLSLNWVFGKIFYPIVWLLGIPVQDLGVSANILGEHLVLNEFVAFSSLGKVIHTLQPKTVTILTYAISSFANFSVIAIAIGALGSIVPERKKDIAKLAGKALMGATLVTLINATLVGVFLY